MPCSKYSRREGFRRARTSLRSICIPTYRRFGTREGMLPVTEDIAKHTLALPFHNNITESQVDHVARALEEAVVQP